MGKNAKSIVVKFLSIVMVFVLAATMANPLTVEAKVKKKTLSTVKSSSNDDPNYLDSIAYVVSPGHYRFKVKNPKSGTYAFIRFMAPEDKDYSFTVNKVRAEKKKNAKSKKKVHANGYFNVLQKRQEPDGYLYSERVANSNLFGTKNSGLVHKKRNVAIACHKGNVLYVEFYVSSSKAKSVEFDFTIK